MKIGASREAQLSRRELLSRAGRYTVGAAAIGSVAGALPGARAEALAAGGGAERWPWPYVKLDPALTAERAYEEWYRVFCGAAVVSAVFGQLREKVGEPYRSFPIDAFMFLEGGVAGWGTICGANAGSCIVANVILGPRTTGSEEGMLMGSELMQRYASTAMPTYVPRNPRVKADRRGLWRSPRSATCRSDGGFQAQHDCNDCHGANVPSPPPAKKP